MSGGRTFVSFCRFLKFVRLIFCITIFRTIFHLLENFGKDQINNFSVTKIYRTKIRIPCPHDTREHSRCVCLAALIKVSYVGAGIWAGGARIKIL